MDQNKQSRPGAKWRLPVLLLLTAAAFGLYANGLNVERFGDDLLLILENPPSRILSAFYTPDPVGVHFRPVKTSVYAVIQALFGLNTSPVHVVQLVLHVLLAWFVYLATLRLGYSALQALLGAMFMLFAQVASFPILASCALDQITVALFGCLSLYLAHVYFRPAAWDGRSGGAGGRTLVHVLSILCYAGTLLSKEVGLSYFALLIVVIAANALADARKTAALARGALFFVPYVAVTVLYLLVRGHFGGLSPRFSSTSEYGFQVGPKVISHVVMSLGAALQPVAGAKVFWAMKTRDILVLCLSMGGAAILAAAAAYGLYRAGRYRTTLCLAVLAVGSLFPTVLLNHISELYVYNCLPFLSVLVGIGLGAMFRSLRKPALKVASAGVLLCVLAGHVVAIQQNTLMAKGNGRRTESLLSQIVTFVPQVPPNGNILLVNPPPTGMEYSRSVMNGFNLLHGWSETRLVRRRSGRSDVNVRIVDWREFATMPGSPDTVPLFTDGEKVSRTRLRLENRTSGDPSLSDAHRQGRL